MGFRYCTQEDFVGRTGVIVNICFQVFDWSLFEDFVREVNSYFLDSKYQSEYNAIDLKKLNSVL